MANIKSETFRFSEDTKYIKEYSIKFLSRQDSQKKTLCYFTTSFDKCLDKISAINKVCSNIQAKKHKMKEKLI